MTRSEFYDGGAYCRTARVTGNNTATAAGSGDNTEVNGAWLDRMISGGVALSAKLVINYTTTLTADATLSFGVQMRDATDDQGTGAADYGDAVAKTVVATGESGGSTETGTVEVDIDLAGAKQYIQAQITPDLSAGATDTAAWSATMVFFFDGRQPVTAKIGTVESD